jgi:hypothetical protein
MPYVDTGRISLFFEDAGSGGVPTLLLHELGGSNSWREVIPHLAVGRRIIADSDGILVLGNDGAAFEQRLEAGDPLVRPVGQVQQGALLDPGLRRGRLLPASR